MSPKTFIGFAIITMLVVIAASFSIATRYSVHKIGFEDKPVLPGFADKVGGVEEIIIQDVKQKLTVKRDGNTWVMADRQNYLASNEVVSDLFRKVHYAKTSRNFFMAGNSLSQIFFVPSPRTISIARISRTIRFKPSGSKEAA